MSHGRLCAKGCTHTGWISGALGSQEDNDTPGIVSPSPPRWLHYLLAIFRAVDRPLLPIRSGSIVIAVIVIVIRPGIMHNSSECAACAYHPVTPMQHHVRESIVSRISALSVRLITYYVYGDIVFLIVFRVFRQVRVLSLLIFLVRCCVSIQSELSNFEKRKSVQCSIFLNCTWFDLFQHSKRCLVAI